MIPSQFPEPHARLYRLYRLYRKRGYYVRSRRSVLERAGLDVPADVADASRAAKAAELYGARLVLVDSEIPDDEKEPILRAYLKRWKWEVGQFFGGVDADSTADELRRISPDHPIFRIEAPR